MASVAGGPLRRLLSVVLGDGHHLAGVDRSFGRPAHRRGDLVQRGGGLFQARRLLFVRRDRSSAAWLISPAPPRMPLALMVMAAWFPEADPSPR